MTPDRFRFLSKRSVIKASNSTSSASHIVAQSCRAVNILAASNTRGRHGIDKVRNPTKSAGPVVGGGSIHASPWATNPALPPPPVKLPDKATRLVKGRTSLASLDKT